MCGNNSTHEMSTVENGLIGNDRMILGCRPYNILSLKRNKINTKSLDLSLLSLYIWNIVGLETRYTIPSTSAKLTLMHQIEFKFNQFISFRELEYIKVL